MKRRCLLLVIILLAIVPIVKADFTIGASSETISSCPTEINLFTIPITNTGSEASIYTVSLSGSAAKWAVAAPPGFVITPGDSQTVFVYATPSKRARIGTYYLDIIISDSKDTKTITETVQVTECFGASLATSQAEKMICSCEEIDFLFKLQNTGVFTENYALSSGGSASRWTTLSNDYVRLKPGEEADIIAHIAPGCDNIGVYGLTLTAKAEKSESIASENAALVVKGCYDFGAYPEQNYYSFCENSENRVPINVENEGESGDTFTLSSTGPGWMSLDRKELTLTGGSGAVVNLVAFPSYGVSGTNPIKVYIDSDRGNERKEIDLDLNVLTCYSTSLSIDAEDDSMCPGTETQHEILLTNAGNFDETYSLTIRGAEWAKLSESSVTLTSSESKKLDLVLSPSIDTPAGKDIITITANAQSMSKSSDSTTLTVDILNKDNCYAVDLASEVYTTEVEYGGSSLIPITVDNLGVQKNTYTLDISGNGASFAQLNPSALEIEGGKSKQTYLYISAPDRSTEGSYRVVVSARDEQGVVSSSNEIIFNVIEEVTNKTAILPKIPEVTNFTFPKITLPEISLPSLNLNGTGWTAGISESLAGFTDSVMELPYVADTYDYLRENWYLGAALIILIVLIIAAVIGKLMGSDKGGDEFIDDFYEKPKKKEKKEGGLWKRFNSWLEADDLEEFEVGWEPKKEKPKPKKDKKKEKGAWDKFMDWLEEEEPVKEKPKKNKKGKKGAWDKFMDWLEED
jgi:uncharacterized membrane protein